MAPLMSGQLTVTRLQNDVRDMAAAKTERSVAGSHFMSFKVCSMRSVAAIGPRLRAK